ncbi:MAG TPA: VacJ family lipoprotein, partial [Gammaproteobacteria bacterium]|nr:VacJ family lipoprotein [Gammaproteobacteria bacterium]
MQQSPATPLFAVRRARRRCALLVTALLAAGFVLSGCASAPPDSVTQTRDPWENFNRSIYTFNDKVDKAIARPVAGAYNRAMPAPARSGFHNMLSNLGEPVTLVNDTLQGKLKQALKDTGRFLINSTIGLLGFFDVAQHVGLTDHKEDLGQTLATWGVPSGPYLVLPFLGPSSVRDAGSLYPDYYTNPLKNGMPPRYKNAATVASIVDTRAALMEANAPIDSAYDPYSFVRDAYLQHRRYEIF